MEDDLAGTLHFRSVIEDATITVGGSHSGQITTAQVYNSQISLNANGCAKHTTGDVSFGRTGMIWDTGGTGHVSIGEIDVYSHFEPSARITFYGCYQGAPIITIGSVCLHAPAGGLVQSTICKKPTIMYCPAQPPACDPDPEQ